DGFGVGGKAIVSFGPRNDFASGAAIDVTGRVLVVGTSDTSRNGTDFAVARLDGGGNLDGSWGSGGRGNTDLPGLSDGTAFDMTVVQSDGKIVVVGESALYGLGGSVAITRYNPDGSLDDTFGSGGKATVGVGTAVLAYPRAVAIDNSGRILVAGS